MPSKRPVCNVRLDQYGGQQAVTLPSSCWYASDSRPAVTITKTYNANRETFQGRHATNAAAVYSLDLPESDKEAFEIIAELLRMATTLLSRKGQFDYTPTPDEWGAAIRNKEFKETGAIAKHFFDLAEDFQAKLEEYKYWSRAWTFQQWARAYDLEVALDTAGNDRPLVLQKVKSKVVYAAMMIADYKLRNGQYALIDVGWSRGLAKPKLAGSSGCSLSKTPSPRRARYQVMRPAFRQQYPARGRRRFSGFVATLDSSARGRAVQGSSALDA